MIIGGAFQSVGGLRQGGLARLNDDGSPDANFRPMFDGEVYDIAIQTNGMIVIRGSFDTVNGLSRPRLARLDLDGTLDASFHPTNIPVALESVALQADGKILLGGYVWGENYVPIPTLLRLDPVGNQDGAFNPGPIGEFGQINAIAVQRDGDILIGGDFDTIAGWSRLGMARLYSSGSLDYSFVPFWSEGYPGNAFLFQADGKILTSLNSGSEQVVRMNASGTQDLGFQPASLGSSEGYKALGSLSLHANGRILIAGGFYSVNGVPRRGLARLAPDGRLDAAFDPGAGLDSGFARALVLPGSGKILVWGNFIRFDGVSVSGIVRLRGDYLLPIIAGQPLSQVHEAGQTATLRVSASGPAPLRYQWWLNGTPILYATNSALTLPALSRRNCGAYSVVVSNAVGTAVSSNAMLIVRAPQRMGLPVWLADGSLQLTSGDVDGGLLLPEDLSGFEVQASTNLVDWVRMTNELQLLDGALLLWDTGSTNHPMRFYRVLER